MSRAIDADKLMHKIGLIPLEYEHRPAINLFYKMIEEMPTLTPQNEWISVEDKLPNKDKSVLIFVTDKYDNRNFISLTKYALGLDGNYEWLGYEHKSFKITHWMSLPAPPGKGNNVLTKEPNEPLTLISISDELPPDDERVLVYRPYMADSDIGPYSVQWGWSAKKDGSYWAHLPDRRLPEKGETL